ncbi:glycoside hydrolase family 1 protein [Allofustis seminis]|uniref:glycoside hydrolase family 1 protein n=1 Tax=Allofustis seminis TaxID=166939 RepID=UPI00036E7E5B|nr:glycoside hydrolase family 1 protein [Allofustis seminis]
MVDIQFPSDFLWGSSTSGPQSEGRLADDGKGDNVWDYWFEKEPEKFFDQVGPQKASTFYENYKTDIPYLKATGHTIFRTSIQWSRLIPTGDGEVNEKAVAFYRDVFKRIKAEGITLYVNLYHFDLPMALMERGGWELKETIDHYHRYARICFEEFGDLVDWWATFNEPIVPVEAGYLGQFHLPAVFDPKRAIQVAYNTQVASAYATKAYHELLGGNKMSIILNLTPAYARSEDEADQHAAKMAELLQARSFLDPSVKGIYPQELVDWVKEKGWMPEYTAEELTIIKENTIDFLGVNFYQPLRVKAPTDTTQVLPFEPWEMPGRRMNPHRGWEIYPESLYDIALNLKDNYGNIDWVVAENGMGVEGEEQFFENGQIQDDYRIDFFKEHLEQLHRGIQEGANCHGYLVWTFIDCWSWLNAYKNRYGLVELDLETGQRRIKKSGEWFKKLSENNGFDR